MSGSFDVKTTPVVTGSVGVNAQFKGYGVDEIVVFGPTVEGNLEHKGWHAGASATVGLGKNYSVEAEVGKGFDINKNWGLDLSATANRTASFAGEKSAAKITHLVPVDGEIKPYINSAEWRPSVTTAGVKAMANYTTNNGKFTFGAGVSGQYATNNAENVSLTTPYMDGQVPKSITTNIIHHKEGFVVSPELAVSFKPTENLSLGAKGNIFGGGLTARYTF